VSTATLSVLLPNYNHARYLPAALDGVLLQSRPPDEVIVVDDCSTDNSVEIIEAFARSHASVRLVKNERNRGVVHSLNLAMSMATGDYVCGVAADDWLLPGFFERSMRMLAAYPAAGLCSTRSTVIDAETDAPVCCLPLDLISDRDAFIPPATAIDWLQHREPWIMGNACVYSRRAFLAEGGYIPELRSFCDGFLQMVLAVRHGACFIPDPLAVWRLSASGYASATQAQLAPALDMWKHAAGLMRIEFADLFPPAFVDDWESQRLCEARVGVLLRLQRQELALLRGQTGRRAGLDRLFMAMVEGTQKLTLAASMGYLWATGDRTSGRVLARIAKSAWRRRRSRRLAAATLDRSGFRSH
jgi:glycosyltransferase involved in cell wall biosynthesis